MHPIDLSPDARRHRRGERGSSRRGKDLYFTPIKCRQLRLYALEQVSQYRKPSTLTLSTATLDCMSACCRSLVQISLGLRSSRASERQESSCTMRILLMEDHSRLAQTIVRGLDEFG